MNTIKILIIISLILTCSLQSMDTPQAPQGSLSGTDVAKIFSTALAANKQDCKEIILTAKSTPNYSNNGIRQSTPVDWHHQCTISFVPKDIPNANSESDESSRSREKQ